jgi:cation/acetate symporter
MAMPAPFRSFATRQINPRLGIYFSIFAAAFAGLTVSLVILEQLGYPDSWVRLIMIVAPAAFAAVIGIASISSAPEDYFASGRRVPAPFNGLIIAVTALGATGLLGITGTFYLVGADALCLPVGFFGGIVLAAILLVPYLRKFGAYTVPSYLSRRFDSRLVGIVAAIVLTIPVMLFLIAELRVGATLVKSLLNVKRGSLIWPAAVAICVTVAPGGMRSLTWSNTAWSLIALIALLIPVSIVSILLTNLPFAQLTYGGLLSGLSGLELANGLEAGRPAAMYVNLPESNAVPIKTPFGAYFGSFGRAGFVVMAFCIMLGVASMPTLLTRAGTAPGVFEARKSMAWAAFLLGVILLTLPAIAVFARYLMLTEIVGKAPERLPEWLLNLFQSGQARIDTQSAKVTLESVMLRRDSILLFLPALAGLPMVLTYVAASGIVAAALAGSSARLVTIANMLSEDLSNANQPGHSQSSQRLLIARLALALVGGFAAWMALQWTVDPLRLVVWSLSLAASTSLPVLVMSIWWKRINKAGVLAGMLAGLAVSGTCIISDAVLGGPDWFGIDSTMAAVFGVPAAVAAAAACSLLTAAPNRETRALVRDMRVPGGETIHDRETRLARSAKPATA